MLCLSEVALCSTFLKPIQKGYELNMKKIRNIFSYFPLSFIANSSWEMARTTKTAAATSPKNPATFNSKHV